MNKWTGKYIIGLTGNIASGKSVVRKILERLGGYGIDADRLAHRALLKDTLTYQRVIERFGKDILDEQGNINRKILGQVVFANTHALNDLEAIIHPFVCQTIEQIIEHIPRQLVIIEAIKLIESGLTEYCNSLWVVHASFETRRSRLMSTRGLSAAEAELRINAQPSPEEKIARADVVIQNDGSLMESCKTVVEAWNQIPPHVRTNPYLKKSLPFDSNHWAEIEQIQPAQADELMDWLAKHPQAAAWSDSTKNELALQEMLCIKPFFCVRINDTIVTGVGWQIENFIACVDDIWASPSPEADRALYLLAEHIESEARKVNCEGMLWFIPSHHWDIQFQGIWESLGYSFFEVKSMPTKTWQETALSFQKKDSLLLAKCF